MNGSSGATSGDLLKIQKVERENNSITSLNLEGDAPKFSSRHAGQYLMVRIPSNGGWSEPHAFTVSNAPGEGFLRVTIKDINEFTARITHLAPGTSVRVAGPYGRFCRGIEGREKILMVAGGVGITPFLSVLRHFKNIKARNVVTLFWANKTLSDSFAGDELKGLTKAFKLSVVHVLSREEGVAKYVDASFPAVHYEAGHLTGEILQKYSDPPSSACYVCGPPPMQNAVLETLGVMGVPRDSIEIESFVSKSSGK